MATAAPALAATRTPPRASLDRQIRTTSNQLEVVIEQYDAIRGSLRRTKTQEVTVEHQLQPLHAAVTAARARVGLIAASVYETTSFGPLVTLMDAGSASQALANLSTINQVARVRQAQIHRLYDAASAYTSRQAKLRDLDAQQSNTYATLAAKRSTIISQIAKLKSLRVAAYGPTGMVATAPVSGFVPVYSPGAAGQAVKFAFAQLGKMYRWAAAGPDTYDCSGLTLAAWRSAGVALPHNAALQYHAVAHVDRTELEPGDLVFYFNPIHHVALYVGADKVIQAPEFGHPITVSDIHVGPIHGYGRPG